MSNSFLHPLVIRTEEELHSVKSILDKMGEEFCFALTFDPHFISSVCYLGFFPMAIEVREHYLLLVKSHKERCLLDFSNLHIPRNVKKTCRQVCNQRGSSL